MNFMELIPWKNSRTHFFGSKNDPQQKVFTKTVGKNIKDRGSRIGSRTLDQGPRTLDLGPWTLDLGPRTKDHGLCFGTNGHPRRDTDVKLRLSKSTIEDLSFYIGFTRTRSRSKDLINDQGSWTLFWHEWAS